MTKGKKHYAPDLKARLALEALKDRYSVGEIASSFEIPAPLVRSWRSRFQSALEAFFAAESGARGKDPELEALEQRLEELRTEQEWMTDLAARHLDLHKRRALVSRDDPDLSILRQSKLLGLHRSGVYYERSKSEVAETEKTGEAYEAPSHGGENTNE